MHPEPADLQQVDGHHATQCNDLLSTAKEVGSGLSASVSAVGS
ncbi:hypothetical protein QNO09_17930 [Streptomyces sp. 378]|nr:hypothetical protein [Streptomyces sp. 378]MDK1345147.1 hypothetical protein [Streptomyces sp. 378]